MVERTLSDREPISSREQTMLKQLVELYIHHGQPVGSKTLAEKADNQLSSATIRKVLGDLEAKGYVHSPHTSAGRIPTSQGYKFFVDSLLTISPLDEQKILDVREMLDPSQSTNTLVASASKLLSEITQMVGVVTIPKHERLVLKHLEFIPLTDKRVLVVLVVNDREVQNRIIQTDRVYNSAELAQASNFLMQHFTGKELSVARQEMLQAMHRDRLSADRLMQTVLEVAGKAFNTESDQGYVLQGEGNLVVQSERQGMEQLHKLFHAFNEKREVLHLLDACLQSDGVQLFIGEGSGYEAFAGYSIVTSRYKIDENIVGVLGVIGPTRMRYDQIIPIVDITAKLLGTALNPSQ